MLFDKYLLWKVAVVVAVSDREGSGEGVLTFLISLNTLGYFPRPHHQRRHAPKQGPRYSINMRTLMCRRGALTAGVCRGRYQVDKVQALTEQQGGTYFGAVVCCSFFHFTLSVSDLFLFCNCVDPLNFISAPTSLSLSTDIFT